MLSQGARGVAKSARSKVVRKEIGESQWYFMNTGGQLRICEPYRNAEYYLAEMQSFYAFPSEGTAGPTGTRVSMERQLLEDPQEA
jgi:hypothetical protein